MITNADKIVEFHLALDGAVPETPVIPSEKVVELRKTLIREEYDEVIEAFDNILAGDTDAKAALMHELADLLYVAYGAFVAFGVDADAVFAEVHRANMQKANGPRRADGKVMKPKDFVPADVASVIQSIQTKKHA